MKLDPKELKIIPNDFVLNIHLNFHKFRNFFKITQIIITYDVYDSKLISYLFPSFFPPPFRPLQSTR